MMNKEEEERLINEIPDNDPDLRIVWEFAILVFGIRIDDTKLKEMNEFAKVLLVRSRAEGFVINQIFCNVPEQQLSHK